MVDKGFNVLELTGKVFPQGKLVGGVKEAWRFAWGRMMAELAPQDEKGGYSRPKYSFGGVLGGPEFPFQAGRYHVYCEFAPFPKYNSSAHILHLNDDTPIYSGQSLSVVSSRVADARPRRTPKRRELDAPRGRPDGRAARGLDFRPLTGAQRSSLRRTGLSGGRWRARVILPQSGQQLRLHP